MNIVRRSLIAASMIAVSTLSTTALHASAFKFSHPTAAFGSKSTKDVQLSLRNTTGSAIELRAGDSVMKIEAGKTLSVNLPAGTRITVNAATSNHAAGDLLIQVSDALKGATIAIS